MKKLLSTGMLALAVMAAHGQGNLTLDSAIATALKNNYGLLIARNQAQIAHNENTLGNAGFLPSLDLDAGVSYSLNNTQQEYSTGEKVSRNGAEASSRYAGAALTWTLFDGLKMFATQGRLKLMADQGELNVKIQVENTVLAVMTSYYDVVRIKELIRSGTESLKIYEERENITRTKLDVGTGTRQDLLQTQVDKNSLRSSLLRSMQQLDEAKANLNLLLARPAVTPFDISDSIMLENRYNREELFRSAMQRNNSLLYQQKSAESARYTIREYESLRYPRIGLNAAWDFTRNRNNASLSTYNQSAGPSAGLTATWNIFNGFNTNRLIRNARLSWSSAVAQYDYTKNTLDRDLLNAWRKYEDARSILELEEDNIRLAAENLDIALQRFRLGASSILEMKDAQNSYEASAARLITARYDAKIAEAELMRLNGDLVR